MLVYCCHVKCPICMQVFGITKVRWAFSSSSLSVSVSASVSSLSSLSSTTSSTGYNTHTQKLFPWHFCLSFAHAGGERGGGLIISENVKEASTWPEQQSPPRGFWSMSCNAMPRTEEMLTKRCEQPWSRDGWSRERRDSEHVSSNKNSRAHRHVFRNINESAPIDAVITNVYHCFTAFLFDSTLCNKPKTEVVFGNLLFKKYKYEQCYLEKKKNVIELFLFKILVETKGP